MSEKLQVRIDIDQGFVFWPMSKDDTDQSMTMWIDVELYERWKVAEEKYRAVNTELEQLYRVQQGLEPYAPVPRHEMVEK